MNTCATPTDAQPKSAVRAPAGDIVAQNWLAEPIDCSSCPHQALLATQGCEPGHACMQDSYARRIDRFFRWHKELAAQHLHHPYFEVRAIAARYTELFHLPALMNDVDETVRLQVALRLPQRLLQQMKQDPHREVRIRVAQRLESEQLPAMVQDPDYGVRQWVARRLTVALLPLLAHDPEAVVRQEVAQRIEMPALLRMADDKDPGVRRIVAGPAQPPGRRRRPARALGSHPARPACGAAAHAARHRSHAGPGCRSALGTAATSTYAPGA
jgi:hypothetical protein